MTTYCDVAIVGAGPAGSAAAIAASRCGLEAVVVDKATFPRDKVCGDGLTTGALRRLEELGVAPDAIPSWNVIDDIVLTDTTGVDHRLPLPRNRGQFAAVARRREVDAELVATARRTGADVRTGSAMTSVTLDGDRVRLVAGDDEIQARYLLAADGMWSPTRKALGLGPPTYTGEWHAFRQYAPAPATAGATDLRIWFEADLLPGYVWSFPLADGTVNVGFGVLRADKRPGSEMAALWRNLLKRPAIAEVLGTELQWEAQAAAWPIPASLGHLPLSAGRVLFVGDAAGATDPMTGEGIGQALETAMLAIDCLVDAGPDRPERAADTYTAQLGSSMRNDHRLAGALSQILASSAGTDGSIRLATATDWTRRNFARWLFEDYPRAVLATPRRLGRRTFNQPGAYAASTV